MTRAARAVSAVATVVLAMATVRVSYSWAGPGSPVTAPGSAAAAAPAASVRVDLSAPDLGAPPPRDLRMRVAASAQPDPSDILSGDPVPAPDPSATPDGLDAPGDTRIRARPERGDGRSAEPLADRVVFRFNLGMGLDGGEPTGDPLLSGQNLSDQRYARLRIYSFGDAAIGSRGIVTPSLSTYFAAQFRFDQRLDLPGQDDIDSNAVPSVHDADHVRDILIRSAYAETDRMFDNRVLAPLYLRAGRQFRYGPAIAHFDGVTAGYDAQPLSVSGYFGRRVELYGFPYPGGDIPTGEDGTRGPLVGADARVDFYELQRVPVVLSGSWLRFDDLDHIESQLALRWSRDVSLNASVRLLDGALARERVHLSARISSVTTVSFEVENRQSDDWVYDLLFRAPAADRTDPRSYLNIGPTVPRVHVDLRAGTVLLRNIDILIRASGAVDNPPDDAPGSSFTATYLEGGLGAEVRLRRTLAIGASVVGRVYDRDPIDLDQPPRFPDITEDNAALGDQSFAEGGLSFRFTQGARKFSAAMELFARYWDHPEIAEDFVQPTDLRGGGRFSVEGWAGDNMRLKGEYEVSSQLATAPELAGLKSLRVLVEAQF